MFRKVIRRVGPKGPLQSSVERMQEKMGKINVQGALYAVTDKGGYNHDVGKYWKMVQTPDGERPVVGGRGHWRFWTAVDRTRPMREAALRASAPTSSDERSDTAAHLVKPLA